ncbi:ATP-binding protein [Chitinophaga cymbidii]|uniref:ATPase n=1 Tax=Chitinophaga cymbidii TaxID=1096750 RepID=A0A512RL50_9BACT|nr:AAA family ATPase [Chitinophaga cymbidii]GEP96380.1 ATPase [Chitinophaga cymbidii]
MLNRNILQELLEWRTRPDRKPLILRGARQVGKTTVVEMFAGNFQQYISLNLEINEEAAPFRNYKNIRQLTEEIFFLKDKSIGKLKDTLLFIDEIQEVPEALNILRYFYEQLPELNVIAAGSLLETAIKGNVKIPVGRVEYKVVRPMSFDEFLQATGDKAALEQFRKVPVNDYAHDRMLSLFHTYTLIGGMPEIVNHYVTHRNLTALVTLYESLIISYINDVEKYGRTNNLVQVIRHVINAAYYEAGTRIKFAHFGNSNYASKEVGEAFRTLEKVMLVHLIYPTTNTALPIVPDHRKSPRLQVLDTGMMNHFAGLQKEIIGAADLDNLYQGKIAEHIVAQELLASKCNLLNNLNFWVRQKVDATAEIDFVVQYDGLIIPVEVKSGASGTLRSLHVFMDAAPHDIAVRLYSGNIRIDQVTTINGKSYNLLSLPYYLAAHIEKYLNWMKSQL